MGSFAVRVYDGNYPIVCVCVCVYVCVCVRLRDSEFIKLPSPIIAQGPHNIAIMWPARTALLGPLPPTCRPPERAHGARSSLSHTCTCSSRNHDVTTITTFRAGRSWRCRLPVEIMMMMHRIMPGVWVDLGANAAKSSGL